MDRELEQALLRAEPDGAVTRRSFAYGALGLLLAGGVATRLAGFRPPSGILPGLHVVQLPALSDRDAEAALAGPLLASLSAGTDPAALLADLRRRRLHLVRMPVFGIDGGIGQPLRIDCPPVSRTLVLAPEPVPVILPIARAGRVVLTPLAAPAAQGPLAAGVVQTTGPTPLPPIGRGDRLVLDVIVQ